MIRLFVWMNEPKGCVIKFMLNKYICGYIVAFGYMFFMRELQTVKMHSNYFKILYRTVADFMPFLVKMLCCGFHDSGSKV